MEKMNKTTDAIIAMQPPDINDHQNHPIRHPQERMTFRIYIRTFWMDYLLMAILGAIALAVFFLRPAANRLFPVYFNDGEVVYPEFAYPLQKNIIPTWLSALLAFLIPFIFIMLMQIRVRSFNDVNAATMGLVFAILCSSVSQVIIKWLIGGLRPHFLAVCKPNVKATSVGIGQGFGGLLFDRSICTGDEKQINFALTSMPSGHSAVAFASLVYCSLYLNGKLKIFSNYRPQFWKFVLFYTPLLGAALISASLTVDHYHNWYDVLAGAIIGTIFAFGAYRFQYASVWDYRFNHIPLPRIEADHGFDYCLDHLESSMSGSRKGGWNDGHIYGAPFDATATLSVLQTFEQSRV
jgi:membrane-associated phospholipid phosphatase